MTIFVATCPVCGIYTRVEDEQSPVCCSCRVPYVLSPEDNDAPEEPAVP